MNNKLVVYSSNGVINYINEEYNLYQKVTPVGTLYQFLTTPIIFDNGKEILVADNKYIGERSRKCIQHILGCLGELLPIHYVELAELRLIVDLLNRKNY